MTELPRSLISHRVRAVDTRSVLEGEIRWSPLLSLWFTANAVTALVGDPKQA